MSIIASVPASSCMQETAVSVEFFVATGLDKLFETLALIEWGGGQTYTHLVPRGVTQDQQAYFNSYAVHLPLSVAKEMVEKPFTFKGITVSPDTKHFFSVFDSLNPCD